MIKNNQVCSKFYLFLIIHCKSMCEINSSSLVVDVASQHNSALNGSKWVKQPTKMNHGI